jgi:5-methyltetrahydrofolate--homocysteine methyltransferase
MNPIIEEIYNGVVSGKAPIVQQKVTEALGAGLEPVVILNEGMIAAMAEVGQRFETGQYFVPEMLIAARAMKTGLAILKPRLAQGKVQAIAKVAAGTVRGDLHDIGKNLVCMMLEGAGFEILDLGTDVAPERFVQAVREDGAQIVAMSALLTTTMPKIKETIAALESAGLRDKVKVMVGGAPVTEAFAKDAGADGYGADASRAVTVAKSLLK